MANMAFALWSMTVTLAPVLGPILGGWITDNIAWPWIFYINVPIGVVSAYLTWLLLRGRESPIIKLPIDVVGLALLVVWVGAVQIMLDRGKELDWFGSNQIIGLAIVAAVGFSIFLAWELTDAHPIVDLGLFRQRNFATGTLAISLGYAVFFGNLVLIPLWLQQFMGYTATWAGLVTAPVGILSAILAPVVGRALRRTDPRYLVTVAFSVFAGISFWRSGFDTDVDTGPILASHFVQGIAMATFFIPLNALALSGIEPARMASASGLFNFARIMCGSFAASVWTTMWEDRATLHHARLTESLDAFAPRLARAVDGLTSLGLRPDQAYGMVENEVNRQAYMQSAVDLFWLSGILFAGLAVLIWVARPVRRSAP
jgi:DHA2 family multidrug resistance protein